MTITTEQLDELERCAQAAKSIADRAVANGHALPLAQWTAAQSADVTLQLVAIARAALAWSEARNSNDHDLAAHELRDALKGPR